MRILVTSKHVYPVFPSIHDDFEPDYNNYKSSQSHCYIQDLIVKGLAELGHEVFYWLKEGEHRQVPEGVEIIKELPEQIDVAHLLCDNDGGVFNKYRGILKKNKIPWVATCHLVLNNAYAFHRSSLEHLIHVSNFCAKTFDSTRFVYNGIDPNEFIFQEKKEDYFLFIAPTLFAEGKGLDLALELAREMEFPLMVAGGTTSIKAANFYTQKCKNYGAEYIGPMYGMQKAKLFAGAKGVLFPSKRQESFGLVAVEGMISGTPVIASTKGALPEIMSSEVGFVCATKSDYIHAIENLSKIKPQKCRDYAMKNFNYLDMAKGYVKEYEKQIVKERLDI